MSVLDEIQKEREAQIAKGFDASHDDNHRLGDLSDAACCYAERAGQSDGRRAADSEPLMGWPWDYDSWKPSTRRNELIKAAALIVAEIEALDRRSKG